MTVALQAMAARNPTVLIFVPLFPGATLSLGAEECSVWASVWGGMHNEQVASCHSGKSVRGRKLGWLRTPECCAGLQNRRCAVSGHGVLHRRDPCSLQI